jgi:hydrogenase expression/formation protein HypD
VVGLAQAVAAAGDRAHAARRFDVAGIEARESPECIAGDVLKGLKRPLDCPAFGRSCTPERPLGATMVSAEGACAAYFAYGRQRDASPGGQLVQLRGGRG